MGEEGVKEAMTEEVNITETVPCPACEGAGEQTVAPVKGLRMKLGVTARALSITLGVSVRTIMRWEAGASTPHPIFIRKLEELVVAKEQEAHAREA